MKMVENFFFFIKKKVIAVLQVENCVCCEYFVPK